MIAEIRCRGVARAVKRQRDRPDLGRHVVGEEVPALEGRAEVRAAVHQPAADRLADAVAVLEDGIGEWDRCRRLAGGEADVRPLPEAPAVVFAALAGGLVVDLFPCALPDVRDDERAVRRIEGELPRIAQSEIPDLRKRADPGEERVIGGDGIPSQVRVQHAHVDAQHLAEEISKILRVVVRIAAASAVTHADVEVAIGAECKVTAVVVRERLHDVIESALPDHPLLGRRVGDERIAARWLVARDDAVAVRGFRVVDVEASARRVVRRKREPQQSLFAARDDAARHVEEIGAEQDAVLDHADASALLDDVLNRWIAGILNEPDRSAQAGDVRLRLELILRGRGARGDNDREQTNEDRDRPAPKSDHHKNVLRGAGRPGDDQYSKP